MEPGTLADRLVAGDPGLVRLRMALRATFTVGTALGILLAVRRPLHLPLSAPLMAAALGMTWSISVNDSARRDQCITALALWLPAAACVALGTFTAADRVLGRRMLHRAPLPFGFGAQVRSARNGIRNDRRAGVLLRALSSRRALRRSRFAVSACHNGSVRLRLWLLDLRGSPARRTTKCAGRFSRASTSHSLITG